MSEYVDFRRISPQTSEILRQLLRGNRTAAAIAKEFGVSRTRVWQIKTKYFRALFLERLRDIGRDRATAHWLLCMRRQLLDAVALLEEAQQSLSGKGACPALTAFHQCGPVTKLSTYGDPKGIFEVLPTGEMSVRWKGTQAQEEN